MSKNNSNSHAREAQPAPAQLVAVKYRVRVTVFTRLSDGSTFTEVTCRTADNRAVGPLPDGAEALNLALEAIEKSIAFTRQRAWVTDRVGFDLYGDKFLTKNPLGECDEAGEVGQ